MSKLIPDPRLHLITGLILVFVTTATKIGLRDALLTLGLCLFSTVGMDLLLSKIKNIYNYIPYSAIITGLILTLIIDPTIGLIPIMAINILAIVFKHYVKINKRHIFNPAAVGLFLGGILFKSYPAWWSVSLFHDIYSSILNTVLFGCLAYLLWVSGYKYRRFYSSFSFLLAFLILYIFTNPHVGFGTMLSTVFSPGLLFFTAVMVPEPMTSPVKKDRQIKYGIAVAVFAVLLTLLVAKMPFGFIFADTFISALILGNLLFCKYR